MGKRLPVSLNYATHLPALIQAITRTSGPVLEIGMGVFSTPYLHYACALQGRKLMSYDNDPGWASLFIEKYGEHRAGHEIKVVSDWDEADLGGGWDVALVDHSPDFRRETEIARLAYRACYVVVHDANGRMWKQYGYDRAFPLYAYRIVYDKDNPHTVVLSNFATLADFWSNP